MPVGIRTPSQWRYAARHPRQPSDAAEHHDDERLSRQTRGRVQGRAAWHTSAPSRRPGADRGQRRRTAGEPTAAARSTLGYTEQISIPRASGSWAYFADAGARTSARVGILFEFGAVAGENQCGSLVRFSDAGAADTWYLGFADAILGQYEIYKQVASGGATILVSASEELRDLRRTTFVLR